MWQDCSLSAVQRKTTLVEKSWWPELKTFGSMPWCSFPRQKLLPRLAPNGCTVQIWSMSLHPCFSPISHRSMRVWTSVFFCRWASNGQVLPKASPRVIFNWKNFIVQWKLILIWMLIERWRRPSMLSSICQHVARLQFVSCAEKDSLCGTVMIHDGLNLRCLDQCHGVRSHGKSSPQSWRKRIVIQESEFSL